jgi:hypothetical protein
MPIVCKERHHSDAETDNRSLDRVIAHIAQRQHGVVARSQLAEMGAGRGAIGLRLRRGRLHIVYHRVYAVGHRVLTDHGRWMAAFLAGGAGSVLSHGSAAALWGIRPDQSRAIELTSARRRGSRQGLRFHCSSLPTDEVTTVDGIPVTTVPRTLFDLAGVIPRRQLGRAVNEAEIRCLWDALSLGDLLARHPRRPGAAAIREILAAQRIGAGVIHSELEDRFIGFLEAANLPRPATNVSLLLDGGWIEADCVWHEQRVIAELDGHATHGTRSAYESDRARDRMLTAAGWRVVRITWRQLQVEPDALARDLGSVLALRG